MGHQLPPDSTAGQRRSSRRILVVILPVLLLLLPLGAVLIVDGRLFGPREEPESAPLPGPPQDKLSFKAPARSVQAEPLPEGQEVRGVYDRLSPLPFDEYELRMFYSLNILHEGGRQIVRVKLTEDGDELSIDAKTGRLLSIDTAQPQQLDASPPMKHS